MCRTDCVSLDFAVHNIVVICQPRHCWSTLQYCIVSMSGIEAIGITLAVFPILVDGLDRVASGIETIKRWKRYKIKLQEYADILKSASVYFFDTLDELLGDIVSSDEELELLLETPGGILWKKPEYEGRLRKRLDRSYSSYLKTISTLVRALRTMGGKLGIDGAGGVRSSRFAPLNRS